MRLNSYVALKACPDEFGQLQKQPELSQSKHHYQGNYNARNHCQLDPLYRHSSLIVFPSTRPGANRPAHTLSGRQPAELKPLNILPTTLSRLSPGNRIPRQPHVRNHPRPNLSIARNPALSTVGNLHRSPNPPAYPALPGRSKTNQAKRTNLSKPLEFRSIKTQSYQSPLIN